MTDEKSNKLMQAAKSQMKLSMVSMAGMGALGAMGNIPGMPAGASNVAGIASSGLALANVGQLANTGMVVADTLTGQSQPKKTITKSQPKKQAKNSVINKILYG